MRPWLPLEAIYTIAFITVAYFVGYKQGYSTCRKDREQEENPK